MNFRQLTDLECDRSRNWQPVDATRTQQEQAVIDALPKAKEAFFASGGRIQVLPIGMMQDVPMIEPTRATKAAILARQRGNRNSLISQGHKG